MNISRPFIERPIATTLLTIGTVLFRNDILHGNDEIGRAHV